MLLVALFYGLKRKGITEVYLALESDLFRLIESLAAELAIALDYDPREDRLYWLDYKTYAIKTSYRNGTG